MFSTYCLFSFLLLTSGYSKDPVNYDEVLVIDPTPPFTRDEYEQEVRK